VREARWLAKYCGPAVVASAEGVSRRHAAQELLRQPKERNGRKDSGLVSIHSVARVLGGVAFFIPRPRVTVKRWLQAHQEDEAILLAHKHFYHVCDGQIVEDNGTRRLRGHVRWVIYLS
jgi:hypothetical protein